MAMTTITIREVTKKRLADYKLGDQTYDEVLNLVLDRVKIEDLSEEHVREHYRRLRTFDGIPAEEFKKRMRGARSGG